MDIATAVGLLLGAALLLISVLIAPGSSLAAFVDVPSGLVVVGGAIAACGIAYPFGALLRTPSVTMKLFFPKAPELKATIAQLVSFAEVARRDGILALENKLDEVQDPFVKMGVQMAVDGTDGELIEAVMRGEIEAVAARHKVGKGLMETLGRYAPAFGMIGTLMGLIIMLGNMDDPEAIGPGMAVALITTLYGAIMSNLFCLPFADKLGYYSKREMEVREAVVRGILSIQEGDNPRVLEQKLSTMLPQADRTLAA
ncbi:motility protein A [Alienimonas californiensis]|uniref:Chemotaxis protein PomA n=1 Tax=Alienimonas californiensis TaxID=2527989 RepID=A0A517PE25_9PLAN|nr:motility protein A [Alienimonas californiensis]QDT17632.1 Chemotaxis protein PomA [Alienimonas californiensis]